MKTLCVWVTDKTNAHQVIQLAQAACLKDIDLRVHLTGEGVLLCRDPVIEALCRLCRCVTVCRQSMQRHDIVDFSNTNDKLSVISCSQAARTLESSDRRIML